MAYSEIILITVGALIGAAITFVFGLLNEWRKDGKTRKQKLKQLLVEIEGNYRLAEDYFIAERLGSVIMSNKAWELSKDEIFSLPTGLQENLRNAYSQLTRFNSVVNLNLYKWEGYTNVNEFRNAINREAEAAKKILQKCEEELRKHLDISQ